jgi:hypothetical protein
MAADRVIKQTTSVLGLSRGACLSMFAGQADMRSISVLVLVDKLHFEDYTSNPHQKRLVAISHRSRPRALGPSDLNIASSG